MLGRSGAGLAVALAAVLVAGCVGREDEARAGSVRLTIWETYNEAEHKMFLAVRDEWVAKKRRETGKEIQLEVSRVPFDGLLPKLKSSCLTGTTPDICRVDYAHVVPMAYGNAIHELDTESGMNDQDLDLLRAKFVPAAIDSCLLRIRRKGRVERHLYGLPDQTNCVTLFYNKAMFEAAAPKLKAAGLDPERAPRDWDELVRYGIALTDPVEKTYGIALDNSLWWTFPFINTFGAEILKQDESGMFHCTLDDALAVEAFQLRVDLSLKKHAIGGAQMPIEAGAWVPGALNKDQGFLTNRYAMAFSGPWNLDTFKRAGVRFGVSLVPAGPAGTSSTVGGTNMVVFKSCKQPRLAYEFLEYLTSDDVQKRWCSELGQIPVRPAVFPAIDVSAKPELKVFFEQMLTARARPPVPNYDKLEEIANAQMDLALQGKKSARDALTDAAARVNSDVLSAMRE
jgi:multiple sugar transport system substrate-binding protein